jgi:hypothetical protein
MRYPTVGYVFHGCDDGSGRLDDAPALAVDADYPPQDRTAFLQRQQRVLDLVVRQAGFAGENAVARIGLARSDVEKLCRDSTPGGKLVSDIGRNLCVIEVRCAIRHLRFISRRALGRAIFLLASVFTRPLHSVVHGVSAGDRFAVDSVGDGDQKSQPPRADDQAQRSRR